MKRVSAFAVVMLVTLGASGVAAQTTDFSGTWTFDAARSQGAPTLPSIAGSGVNTAQSRSAGGRAGQFDPATGRVLTDIAFNKLTVKQTPTDLFVAFAGLELVYKLDGSKNNISAAGRAGFPRGQVAWDGPKLVITAADSVYVGQGQYRELPSKEIWSLDGNTLTIDKTETTRAQATVHNVLVYTKATS